MSDDKVRSSPGEPVIYLRNRKKDFSGFAGRLRRMAKRNQVTRGCEARR